MRFYNQSKDKQPSVVNSTDDIHRRQKRAVLRAFSDSALKSYEPTLNKFVDLLVQRLKEHTANRDNSTDMTEWYNYVLFDFTAMEIFGESLGCLEGKRYHPWVEMLFASIRAWSLWSISKYFFPFTFAIKIIVACLYWNTFKGRNKKSGLIASKVTARESEFSDMMNHIERGNDPKASLNKGEILSNSSFLMMAGSETSATLLSGCTYYLLRNPKVYSQVVSEIRESFDSTSDMKFAALAKLPYLRSVLYEGLRMYPPVPLGMPRVVPKGGAVIAGKFVPEQTSVAVPSWASYRTSLNFDDPDCFLPERWIEQKASGLKDQRSVYQPFSLGPRGCPGKSLALAETSLILARIFWNFDMQLLPESANWDDQNAFIVWDKHPLMVKLIQHSI